MSMQILFFFMTHLEYRIIELEGVSGGHITFPAYLRKREHHTSAIPVRSLSSQLFDDQ